MFTGIITAVGRIESRSPHASGARLAIRVPGNFLDGARVGDSIAVSGVCLTVVELDAPRFAVDVSRETLDCTKGFAAEQEVNLERALRMGDALGGHLVTGHVDGVGRVVRFEPEGESWRLDIEVPGELAPLVARKGSVSVDGVSLTVNAVEGQRFGVNIIPHTYRETTLRNLDKGVTVNIEVDLFARYIERMLSARSA